MCIRDRISDEPTHSKANKLLSFEKLAEHTEEFNKSEILTLLNGKIHVAIGKINVFGSHDYSNNKLNFAIEN